MERNARIRVGVGVDSRSGDRWIRALCTCLLLFVATLGNCRTSNAVGEDQEFLDSHNAARDAVNAGIPNLVWNTTLADYAQSWSDSQATDANNCILVHSGGPYGENLYYSSASSTPTDAASAWVAEKQYYDYSTNSCIDGQVCQHYTQVIWKNTVSLGCGSSTCPGGGTFTTCSYDPPGNMAGETPY